MASHFTKNENATLKMAYKALLSVPCPLLCPHLGLSSLCNPNLGTVTFFHLNILEVSSCHRCDSNWSTTAPTENKSQKL